MQAALPCLLLLLAAQDVVTVLTRGGRKLAGPVVQDGAFTRVGAERVPTSDVLAIYRNAAEAVALAQDKFGAAKAAYAEAEKMDVAHPGRNDALRLAIEQAQAASGIYQAIDHAKEVQVLQQFLRICRSASTSELAAGTAARGPLLPLAEADFKAEAAAEVPERPWVLGEPLAPGLGARAKALESPEPERRLEAARALLHPPAPEHLPALLRLLEAETDPAVVGLLAEGLGLFDPGPLLPSLAWVRRAPPGPKRAIVMELARAAGDKGAFDFVSAWFAEAPPATNAERALFAGAFRQFQAWSVPWLRELLTKQRQPKLQIEILRQMGVLGDKAFGVLLVKALPAYPRDAAVALQKMGKPAVPFLMEGARSLEPDLRQPCLTLLRRITGVNGINMGHFEKWWDENRKAVIEAEAEGRDGPVRGDDFDGFGGR